MILDIGLETREVYHQIINQSETIIWNGPVGAFEFPPFVLELGQLLPQW